MAKLSLHNLFSSPVGRICMFLFLLASVMLGLYAVRAYKEPLREQSDRTLKKAQDYTYSANVKEFTPTSQQQPKEKEPEKPAEPEAAPVGKNPVQASTAATGTTKRAPVREVRPGGIRQELRLSQSTVILPICLYAKTKADSTTVSEDTDIAPYGRLLRCELANTISTSSLQTPVIALVTESLWWDGVEIIPAGVEVHGTVSGSPSRDRIGTSSSWIVVYPYRDHRSAYQMQLTGIALDCNRTDTSWGKSDGTAGIRGIVISNADAARAAGYIASFISGLGQGMVKETTEYVGNSTRETTGGTWKDILGKAFSNSAEKIATDMLQQAAKEVSYVEAEAGTEFYIYVQQVVDPTQAARGKMSAGNKLTRGEEKETSRSNLVIPQKRN